MDVVEKRTQLIMDIFNSNISLAEVRLKITDLEEEFGDDAFSNTSFNAKPRPWDEKYLQELKIKAMSGVGSKEFILHIAEVKQELSKRNKNLKPIYILICVLIGISLFFISFLYSSHINKKIDSERKNLIEKIENEELSYQKTEECINDLLNKYGKKAFGRKKLEKKKGPYTEETLLYLNEQIDKYDGRLSRDSILFYSKVVNEVKLEREAKQARKDLFEEIATGTIDITIVNKKIENQSKKYGDKAFYEMKFDKKKKPWSKEYFIELTRKIRNLDGNFSKEYLKYYIEVKEYVDNLQ